MNEFDKEAEINAEEQIQAEIDRIDTLKAALPEIDESDPEAAEQESQYQEKIWELQAKLYESRGEEAKETLLTSYLDRNLGYYQELAEMGMPVEPEMVWNDFFGGYTEMSAEARGIIQDFIDGLSEEGEIEDAETSAEDTPEKE